MGYPGYLVARDQTSRNGNDPISGSRPTPVGVWLDDESCVGLVSGHRDRWGHIHDESTQLAGSGRRSSSR